MTSVDLLRKRLAYSSVNVGAKDIALAQIRGSGLLFAALLAMAVGVAGCGVARHQESLPKIVGTRAVRLATDNLAGGYVTIFAERQVHQGVASLALYSASEKRGKRGIEPGRPGMVVTGGSSGVSVMVREHRPLALTVEGTCRDGEERLLVYGLLGNAQDSVIARMNGIATTFKRVAIPASLGSNWVLFYAEVPPGGTDVLVHTRTGRVVARQRVPAHFCGSS